MNWRDLEEWVKKQKGWRYEIGDSGITVYNAKGVKTYCKYEAIQAHELENIKKVLEKGGKLPFKAYPRGYEYRYQRKVGDIQEKI